MAVATPLAAKVMLLVSTLFAVALPTVKGVEMSFKRKNVNVLGSSFLSFPKANSPASLDIISRFRLIRFELA